MISILIKTAWRNISFHKISSLIHLTGLTVSTAAAFLIFMWVRNEYSYDSYHQDADRIYRMTTVNELDADDADERTPYLIGEEVKARVPEVQMLARVYPLTVYMPTIKIGNDFFMDKGAAFVDDNWFKLFQFKFIAGTPEEFNNAPNGVVLSASNSKKYFGSAHPIGKSFQINGNEAIVTGVVDDYPPNSSFRFDLYITDRARPVNPGQRQFMSAADSYQTYIKLNPGASTTVALSKINGISPEMSFNLISLADVHFESLRFSSLKHGDKKLTRITLVLGVLLLLIACMNYLTLTTAQVSARIKEISIKKITGSSRQFLFFQFLTESILINMIASAGALMLVWLSTPWFNSFTDNHFIFSLSDLSLWQLVLGTSFGTVLLAGLYPALLLSSLKPAAGLQTSDSLYFGGGLRKLLVVVQFSMSIILIIGTIVIEQQMNFVDQQYDQYDRPQLFSVLFQSKLGGDEKVSQMNAFKQSLLANSSIEKVSTAGGISIINRSNTWAGFDWDGKNPDIRPDIHYISVGSDLDKISRLEITDGRWFSNDQNDSKNFVLNETAVKELHINKPVIGQRFSLDQDTGRIVGVIKDFHFVGVHSKIPPLVIGNNPDQVNSLFIKTAVGRQADALAHTETVWKKFAPDQPFQYQFASEEFDQLYRTEQKSSLLIWVTATLAIFISCLGLYGLATFNTERRIKEIGIRKVLGASIQHIVKSLSSEFVYLLVIAMVIAFPLGWWAANKWLQNFVYHVEPSWTIFAGAGVLALSIALLTISFRTVKAARKNPVESLRTQ